MSSKHFAYLFSALYVVVLFFAFRFGRFTIKPSEQHQSDIIYIEYVATPPPPPKPKPLPKPKVKEAPRHENLATRDNFQQVSGEAEVTRTVNKRALFKMSKDGADKPDNAGNPNAKRDTETKASGKGGGLNPIGSEALDEGLQGRGLVGSLPQPVYPAGNKRGTYKVVVRVVVNQNGAVTDASYEQNGSTTNDKAFVDAALAAARKARFTESKAYSQGGKITYVFITK